MNSRVEHIQHSSIIREKKKKKNKTAAPDALDAMDNNAEPTQHERES